MLCNSHYDMTGWYSRNRDSAIGLTDKVFERISNFISSL